MLPVLRFALLVTLSAWASAAELGDDFRRGLANWAVEQQPGGTVTVMDGVLRIDDADGCTVWFRPRLRAPVSIRYEARVLGSGRVSDLNCFWMATDPRHADLLGAGHSRDGRFAAYDGLQTYYVGYGGNGNTTTRFRRYDGSGARPLLPEHERRAPAYLLQADHPYRLELSVDRKGMVRFRRDGETVFEFHDPQPLIEGWFGFRTVHSRIEIRDFSVTAEMAAPPPARTAPAPREP